MPSCLGPVAAPDARVLVLGTVPGAESLRLGQYYANPRNAFWRLIGDLFHADPGSDYDSRTDLILRQRVALWDVLATAQRENSSLDSRIRRDSEAPNDIAGFLETYPGIRHVFLNGAKAAEVFERHHRATLPAGITVTRLPSTSPANAAVPYEEKLAQWRAVAIAAGG